MANLTETTTLIATETCNRATYTDSAWELEAQIEYLENGDYQVTTTVKKPATGALSAEPTNNAYILSSPSEEGEIMRVREIVYTFDKDTSTNIPSRTFTVSKREQEKDLEEVISIRIDQDSPLGLPKRPKAILIRQNPNIP